MDTKEYKQVEEYNNQGNMFYTAGKYDEALEMYKKAEKEDPMCVDTYINMAEMFLFQLEFDKAKAAVNKVFYIDKNNATAYFVLGNISYMTRDFKAARTNYSKAVALGYKGTQVFFQLGLVYEEFSDVENAIAMYNKAIRIDKYLSNARLRKIILLVTEERYEDALKVADELIDVRPELFEGYHYKFITLLGMENYEEAKRVIDVALSIYSDDLGFRYDQVKYLEQTKAYEEALKVVDTYFTGTPENEKLIRKEKSKILFALHRLEEARALFNNILDEQYDGEICYLLMIVESGYAGFEKVLECCNKIINEGEKSNYYYCAIYYEAVCLKKMGKEAEAKVKYEAALKEFRSACMKQPGNVALFLFRALCYRETKNYEKAFEMVNYIDALTDGTEAQTLYVRSQLYEDIKEMDKASADREKAFLLNPQLKDIFM